MRYEIGKKIAGIFLLGGALGGWLFLGYSALHAMGRLP